VNCFEWEISWKSFSLWYFGKPFLFKTLYHSCFFKCWEKSFFILDSAICPNIMETMWFQAIFYTQFLFLYAVLVSRLFLSMIKACFGNLVMGILLSLNQYLKEEIVLSIYRRYLPVSPYTMWFGVLARTLNNLLQAKRWTVSIFASLEVLQTSEAYKSMGLICALKSWKNTVVSTLPRDHIVFIKSKHFPLALLAKSSQV